MLRELHVCVARIDILGAKKYVSQCKGDVIYSCYICMSTPDLTTAEIDLGRHVEPGNPPAHRAAWVLREVSQTGKY